MNVSRVRYTLMTFLIMNLFASKSILSPSRAKPLGRATDVHYMRMSEDPDHASNPVRARAGGCWRWDVLQHRITSERETTLLYHHRLFSCLSCDPEHSLTLVNSTIRWSIVAQTYLHGDRINALLSPPSSPSIWFTPSSVRPIPDRRPHRQYRTGRYYGGSVTRWVRRMRAWWRRTAFPTRGPSRIYARAEMRPFDCLIPVFGRYEPSPVPCTCSIPSSPVASDPHLERRAWVDGFERPLVLGE